MKMRQTVKRKFDLKIELPKLHNNYMDIDLREITKALLCMHWISIAVSMKEL